jgi:pyruvate,orthophosphate dikinase
VVHVAVTRRAAGIGFAFSRNPAHGRDGCAGRFWPGRLSATGIAEPLHVLADRAPIASGRLADAMHLLEVAYGRICVVIFALDGADPVFLDVRPAEVSPVAAARFAVQSVDEMLVEPSVAVSRVPRSALEHEPLSALACGPAAVLAVGAGRARGAAIGPLVTAPERVEAAQANGGPPILAVPTLDDRAASVLALCAGAVIVEDVPENVLPSGTCPVVCRVESMALDPDLRRADFPSRGVCEGDTVAVDGGSGLVATGRTTIVISEPNPWAVDLAGWTATEPRPERAGLGQLPGSFEIRLVVNPVSPCPHASSTLPV